MLGQLFTVAAEELKYSFVYLKYQISNSQHSTARLNFG